MSVICWVGGIANLVCLIGLVGIVGLVSLVGLLDLVGLGEENGKKMFLSSSGLFWTCSPPFFCLGTQPSHLLST